MRWTTMLALALAVAATARADQEVSYPDGYRQWTHVKSMLIHDPKHPLFGAFGGIHHVYVNPAGRTAMEEGRAFPDGTVLVFDLLEAKEDGGAWIEGRRKVLAVMRKDAARFAATGGWGFEGFKEGARAERVVTDARGQCFGCHQSAAKTDHVFTRWRP